MRLLKESPQFKMITNQHYFFSIFTFIILFGEGRSCQCDAGKVIAESNITRNQDVSKYAIKRVEYVT